MLSIMFSIVVFSSILFIAYITTKYIGKKTKMSLKGKHVRVVEVTPLGFDKQIYMVKAGKDLVLLAASGRNISFLTKVELEDDERIEEIEDKDMIPFDFKSIFDKYIKRGRNTKDEWNSGNSLRRIKSVSERIKTTKDKHGDE